MSMMIIMLLLRAWIVEMRATSVKPRGLADDLLMVASGPNHVELVTEAVEKNLRIHARYGGEGGYSEVHLILLLPHGEAQAPPPQMEMRESDPGGGARAGPGCSPCGV